MTHVLSRLLLISAAISWAPAAELTFLTYSDTHYGADAQGKKPPKTKDPLVETINALPGMA